MAQIADRKLDQLRACLAHDVQHRHLTTRLEQFRLQPRAAAPIAPQAVDLSCWFLGHRLSAPILIGAMTGGTEAAGPINRNLAAAAQTLGLAMGVGSQRAAIVDPSLAASYQVREVAPDIVLLANLGFAQLGQGWGLVECRAAVDMIQADGLVLHFNPWQELVQEPESAQLDKGLEAIPTLVAQLPVPIIVKEVGWGLPEGVARQLWEYGVTHFDTGAAGGTCWAEVLRHSPGALATHPLLDDIASRGLPTADATRLLRQALPGATIIAGGGIRTGEDIAKAIALGADLVSIAHPLLRPATVSGRAVERSLAALLGELRAVMAHTGVATTVELERSGVCVENSPHAASSSP